MRPVIAGSASLLLNNSDPAELRHADPLAVARARPAPVGRLVRERLRRPHRQPHHAGAPLGGRRGLPDLRRHRLRGRLHRRRRRAALGRRRAAAWCRCRSGSCPTARWCVWTVAPHGPRLQGRLRGAQRRSPAASWTPTPTSTRSRCSPKATASSSYAREAMERARATPSSARCGSSRIMDIALTLLNGVLIVRRHRLGDLALDRRRGHASAWSPPPRRWCCGSPTCPAGSCWRCRTFFRNLGVVAEGMETIAQPVALLDAPGARPLRVTEGRIEMQGAVAPLRPRLGRARPPRPRRRAGPEGRPRRPLGRRQVHARQAAPALLRRRGRAHPDRRPGHRRASRRTSLRAAIGMVQQDSIAPPPLGAREHPLRPPRRDRGGDGRRRPAGRGARLHPGACATPTAAAATTPRWASAA